MACSGNCRTVKCPLLMRCLAPVQADAAAWAEQVAQLQAQLEASQQQVAQLQAQLGDKTERSSRMRQAYEK